MNFAPVMLGSAAFVFLNFGLPIYTRELGANAIAIGGLYTVFTLTMLLVRPVVGWALDRFGRRWFFTGAFLFYSLAMLAFAQASNLTDFYLARFLQGIGASLMWVSARTIIADVTGLNQRGRVMGQLTARSVQGSMIGAFYGFTLLSIMPTQSAWQFAFLGYAAAASLGLILSLRQQRETAPRRDSQPSRIHLTPTLRKIMIIVFLSGFASALIEPIYLIFLQDKFDLPVTILALAFFPAGIVFAVLPQYGGKLSDRYGRGSIIALGITLAGLVSACLPWLPSIGFVAVMYTLFAAGWALASPAEDALVADLATEQTRGRVFGYKEASGSLGAALGPLAGGVIYEGIGAHWAFAANGSILFITAIITFVWFVSRPGRLIGQDS